MSIESELKRIADALELMNGQMATAAQESQEMLKQQDRIIKASEESLNLRKAENLARSGSSWN